MPGGLTYIVLTLLAVAIAALALWRTSDIRADETAWQQLAAYQPDSPRRFDASMVADLPEPARRFFEFAISPGTPLATVAAIEMEGELGLGNREQPNYQPMRAEQILAAPHGFVWRVRAGTWLRMAGSDGAADGTSWSRFWLYGIVPIARAGGSADHLRSAFGRYVAEAVFWTPAALLPGEQVTWEETGDDAARVTVAWNGLEQSVDLHVDGDGRPAKVEFRRWSDANPDQAFRFQPFGGYLSEFEEFGGFRLPTRVEAGNLFGTDDYFPFFRANVTSVRFPGLEAVRE